MGMMDKLGFEGDPRKWGGKTIVLVELFRTKFGSINDKCLLFTFEDGTRGWLLGRPSNSVLTGPDIDQLENSKIITAEEYGALVAERKREADAREDDRKRQTRQELERLKKELGEQ